MLLQPLAFAAAAAAFMVVPEISEADEGVYSILPVFPIHADSVALPASALAQSVSVPCPQCKGSGDHMELDFAVEDRSRLTVNGFELYPNTDPWSGELKAVMVKDNGKEKEKTLGYSLRVEPGAVDEKQQMQLISVELRIMEIGSQFVEGVPTVKVQLVKAAVEGLAIGTVELTEASEIGCSSMWCRAKEMVGQVMGSLEALKDCAGLGLTRPDGLNGDGQDEDGYDLIDVAPVYGSQTDKDTHEDFGQGHDWHLLMRNMAWHILLPVLMGITAGVGVAVFAMVLCSVAVRVTRLVKCRRSKGSRCCRRRQASRRQKADVEKVGLMEPEHEDAPPGYEDGDAKI